MSADIHFAAEVRASETARVGRARAARKVLICATRSCSAPSRPAPSANCGGNNPSKPTTASRLKRRAREHRIITPLAAAHACGRRDPGESRQGVRTRLDADLIRRARLAASSALGRGLAAAYGGVNFRGEPGRDVCLDADSGLFVVHALERPARAALL